MTKQYERIVNLETGETTDRELTKAEISELSETIPEHAKSQS